MTEEFRVSECGGPHYETEVDTLSRTMYGVVSFRYCITSDLRKSFPLQLWFFPDKKQCFL